jgi:hypothetical protein
VGDFRFYWSVHGNTGGGGDGRARACPAAGNTPALAPVPGTPDGPVGAPEADTTAPKITHLAVTATRRALTVRLTLSEPSRVTVDVQRNRLTVAARSSTTVAQGAPRCAWSGPRVPGR